MVEMVELKYEITNTGSSAHEKNEVTRGQFLHA
jgi:hypothetical protein